MQPAEPLRDAADRREKVWFGTVLPMLCFIAGDIALITATGTNEARQFAAIPVAFVSVLGFPILIFCNYVFVSGRSSGKARLFLRGLRLPMIALALEALFIFR